MSGVGPVSASPAIRRSALMQLIGKGFAHPEPEFHRNLLNSAYQRAVEHLNGQLFGRPASLAECDISFSDYESSYIELFQHGPKGRPAVSLHSGDYPELLDGKTRAEHMLDCLAWYRHFGLELPADPAPAADHVVCQFDFLAWLAWLECGAADEPEVLQGYRQAQRDFINIQLVPLLRVMQREFGHLEGRGEAWDGFGRLIRLALGICERFAFDLDRPRSKRRRKPDLTSPPADAMSA